MLGQALPSKARQLTELSIVGRERQLGEQRVRYGDEPGEQVAVGIHSVIAPRVEERVNDLK